MNTPAFSPSIGITKREFFVALAMQGLLAQYDRSDIPEMAIELADKILKALEANTHD